jgi:hypothetical protein
MVCSPSLSRGLRIDEAVAKVACMAFQAVDDFLLCDYHWGKTLSLVVDCCLLIAIAIGVRRPASGLRYSSTHGRRRRRRRRRGCGFYDFSDASRVLL